MKERPILFSGAMPRQARAGNKTHTRRVAKFEALAGANLDFTGLRAEEGRDGWQLIGATRSEPRSTVLRCPYGVAGDRLWVREEHFRFGHWVRKSKPSRKTGRYGYRFIATSTETRFIEDEPADYWWRPPRDSVERAKPRWYKRLARFMPRTSSRTLLEVVRVHVERLHDITEADAMAEGIEHSPGGPWRAYDGAGGCCYEAIESFRTLWSSINGSESWAANPWVWVVEFQRVSP